MHSYIGLMTTDGNGRIGARLGAAEDDWAGALTT
jgi:hypothetical protein